MYIYTYIYSLFHNCYTLTPALGNWGAKGAPMDLRPAMIQDLCLSFMVAAGTLEILKGIRLWDLLRSFTPRLPLSFPMKKRGDEKLEQIKAEAWGLKPNVLGRLDTFRSRHFMFGEPTRRWKFTHVMTICEENYTSVMATIWSLCISL